MWTWGCVVNLTVHSILLLDKTDRRPGGSRAATSCRAFLRILVFVELWRAGDVGCETGGDARASLVGRAGITTETILCPRRVTSYSNSSALVLSRLAN